MQLAERLIKERLGAHASTRAAVWATHPELMACVRSYVTRSTMGAQLTAADRRNYFPATPTCAITWFIHGDYVHLDSSGKPIDSKLPRPVMFSGAHTQPTISANPGEVDVFVLMIFPDALHALTGIDIAAQVDRYCAPAEVLDADWQGMVDEVFHAADNAQRMQLIESFLLPRWRATGQRSEASQSAFEPWARLVGERASSHALGRSDRQIDRRIKDWTGLPLRHLRGIGRAEGTLFQARDAIAEDHLKWADIAATMGFSDQAHLSREFRRITGVSPGELKELIEQESYWIFQLWS